MQRSPWLIPALLLSVSAQLCAATPYFGALPTKGHGATPAFTLNALPAGIEGAAQLYSPVLKSATIEAAGEIAPGRKALRYGGYYALSYSGSVGNEHFSTTRYFYRNGQPSKVSPRELTALVKTPLEIVPVLLPREHDRYTASKRYRFTLRYRGQPVAGLPVTLTTANGTTEEAHSDASGEVAFVLPSDFEDVKTGRRANRPADFMLESSYTVDTLTHHATLRMPYHVNPTDHWQSIPYGAAAAGAGFLGGLLMVRRFNRKAGDKSCKNG